MRALLIGESWGWNELQFKHPFVGKSGQELSRMGVEAGLWPPLTLTCKHCGKMSEFGYCPCGNFNPITFFHMVSWWSQVRNQGVGVTNVFQEHPEKDDETLFFGRGTDLDICRDLPPYQVGSSKLYLKQSHRHHIEALEEEIRVEQPNILILLGNTACWAVLGQTGITKIRGTVVNTRFNVKAIPTFHPAALRNWKLRPTIVSDLKKAQSESHFPGITRPKAWITTYPTLDEVKSWFSTPSPTLSCDIESGTALYSKTDLERMKKRTPKAYGILTRLISMVGFSNSEDRGLVIPFLTRHEINGNLIPYWSSQDMEVRAWQWVQYGLDGFGAELVFQNGLYDVNRLLCSGIRPRRAIHDTMLLHHALFPELPKGLGFLDSIYRNDSPWKKAFQSESLKRDE